MIWGWFNIWRSPKYFPYTQNCPENENVLTMDEYGAYIDTHQRPYIVIKNNLVLFGAEHTKDPDDKQIKLIAESFKSLKPTTVLVEGRLGFLFPYLMNPVKEFGESGYAAKLAKSEGAQIYSWEIPKSDLILELVKLYPKEQVALSQILSPYFSNLRFGKPDDPNQYVVQFLNRASYPGLDNCIQSVEDIDNIWKRDFAESADWRETSDQYGLPGYLSEIASSANLIRNRYLLCAVNELTASGERVFVICGSSHAVCVEPAL
jgi:hypothetical protein